MSRTAIIALGCVGVALSGGVAFAAARKRRASPDGLIAAAGAANVGGGSQVTIPAAPPPPPPPPGPWASGSVGGHPYTVGPDGVTVDDYHAGKGELVADVFTGGAVTATKYAATHPSEVLEIFGSIF
jgi:hypothetical protein